MKCINCGQELGEGMQFCFSCGAKVAPEEERNAADPEPETAPESETVSEIDSAPASETARGNDTQPEAVIVPEAEIAPETETAVEAETVPETETAPEAETAPEKETSPEAAAESETGSATENTQEEESAAESENAPESETVPESENAPENEDAPEKESTPDTSPEEASSGEENPAPDALPEGEAGDPGMPTPLPLTRLRSALQDASGEETGGEEKKETQKDGFTAFREIRERLGAIAGSGTMMLLCILLSVQIAFSLVAGMVSLVASLSTLPEMIRNGNDINLRVNFPIVGGPSLLVIAEVVILWILLTKARKGMAPGKETGLLKTLRIFMIIECVGSAVGAGICLLMTGFYMIFPLGMLMAESFGSMAPAGFPTWIFIAMVPVFLFLTGFAVLAAVYYGWAAYFFGDLQNVLSGRPAPIRTGFLRVFCWIQVGYCALTAVASAALIGAGRGIVYNATRIFGYPIAPEVASRIVTSVAIVMVISVVSSVISAVVSFAKERLYRAAGDAVREVFGSPKA